MTQAPKFDDYAFEIRPLTKEEGGGFLITWADLPGCMADGETPAEAIKQGKDAFRAWMRAQAEDGREIPRPGSDGEPAKFVQRLPKSLHYRLVAFSANDQPSRAAKSSGVGSLWRGRPWTEAL
jgi:antitoxin HicB